METVRIVPPEPYDKDALTLSQGTRVLQGDGGSPEVWSEIHGIKTIDVHYVAGEPITADVELFVTPDTVDAVPLYIMTHPITGERQTVKRIEFTDGSVFYCGAIDITDLESESREFAE